MKSRKIYGIIIILLVFIFPFRYAVLETSDSNPSKLFSFLATIIGTLVFMGLTITDNKEEKK